MDFSMDCRESEKSGRLQSMRLDQGILRNVNGDVFLPSAGLAVLEQIQLSVSYTG